LELLVTLLVLLFDELSFGFVPSFIAGVIKFGNRRALGGFDGDTVSIGGVHSQVINRRISSDCA
jgi:hypothetical protein